MVTRRLISRSTDMANVRRWRHWRKTRRSGAPGAHPLPALTPSAQTSDPDQDLLVAPAGQDRATQPGRQAARRQPTAPPRHPPMAAPRKPPTPKPPPRKPPPKPPILADAESVTSSKAPIAAPATIASVLVLVTDSASARIGGFGGGFRGGGFGSLTFGGGTFLYGIELRICEMQLRRARRLSSERTICHGACLLSVACSIISRAFE